MRPHLIKVIYIVFGFEYLARQITIVEFLYCTVEMFSNDRLGLLYIVVSPVYGDLTRFTREIICCSLRSILLDGYVQLYSEFVVGKVRTKVYKGYIPLLLPVPNTLVAWCDFHTRTRHFGKFVTTSIPVPDTLISSVLPRQNTLVSGSPLLKYPRLGTDTGKSSTTIPDSLVSLVKHPYLCPTLW